MGLVGLAECGVCLVGEAEEQLHVSIFLFPFSFGGHEACRAHFEAAAALRGDMQYLAAHSVCVKHASQPSGGDGGGGAVRGSCQGFPGLINA